MSGSDPYRIVLKVQDLAVRRGAKLLLSGLDFSVEAGQLVIVRGANGSGKTSLIRTLAGLSGSDGDAGEAILWQFDEPGGERRDEPREHISYVAHHPAIHPALTALENLKLGLSLQQKTVTDEQITPLFKQLGLNKHLAAARLSQGQQRRLALMQLKLAARPVWLLDEPLTALDDTAVTWFRAVLAEHLGQGGCCVMSLHQDFDWPGAQLQILQLNSYSPKRIVVPHASASHASVTAV